ncbi:hypothetical protein GGI21_001659, partial [Coemansia aciculifera]
MSGVGNTDRGGEGKGPLKRARSDDDFVVKDDARGSSEYFDQQQQWMEPATPSKQPSRIKLSLKLGALKLQQQAAPAQQLESLELGGEAERQRQVDSMYMTPTSATP